tara:strand:- start:3361 stop:4215 length:855 start_codon:yes stop_codon:yes gene_type:complete
MISMTGYVKKDLKIEGNSYTIIIKSLNSTKGLDISIKTPRYFIDLENDIRKLIVNELIRGKIDFRLIENTNFSNLKFNSKKLDACIKSIRKIMPNVDSGSILNAAIRFPDIFDVTNLKINSNSKKIILDTISKTLKKLNSSRKKEGGVLMREIQTYINLILKTSKELVSLEKKRQSRKKAKVLNHIKKSKAEHNNARLEAEMIYYFERNDITEERVRLQHHCKYFLQVVKKEKVIGKKLMFISQEVLREINTIGSKANDFEIQKIVVAMKEQVEKTKEQLQNIL